MNVSFINFYCYSITLVCIFSQSLHPTPAEPTTLSLDFVHVSFIVVRVVPSPHCPLPTPIWQPLSNYFSLAFKSLSLFLTFVFLIIMCVGVGLFAPSILFGTLCFLDLYVYFLQQFREVFFHCFFK